MRDQHAEAEQQAKAIDNHYRSLFAEAEAALAEANRRIQKSTTLEDERLEAARAALYDDSGFLAVPPKPEFAFDAETLAELRPTDGRGSHRREPSTGCAGRDGCCRGNGVDQSSDSHSRQPSESGRSGQTRISRGDADLQTCVRSFRATRADDLELARWMASTQHPLDRTRLRESCLALALWRGIGSSTENFGVLGDRPSHPELLDWLARRFMESGWSTKQLHRLILSSSVYQMASDHPDDELARERRPGESLAVEVSSATIGSGTNSRLDPGHIRPVGRIDGRQDGSAAESSIRLQSHVGRPHEVRQFATRVYLPVIRNNLYTLFEQFDFPDPTMPTGNRNSTIVAPQALLLMNSELVMDSADELAADLLGESSSDSSRIEHGLCASPGAATDGSGNDSRDVDLSMNWRPRGGPIPRMSIRAALQRAWSLFCQSLFASNEFIYVR